jgi:hypothetical protein
MNTITNIFSYYDQAIASLSASSQAAISMLLLLFLIWQIYQIFKHGHWIFIAALIIFLPGTWPAARFIANLVITIIKLLIIRIQSTL